MFSKGCEIESYAPVTETLDKTEMRGRIRKIGPDINGIDGIDRKVLTGTEDVS